MAGTDMYQRVEIHGRLFQRYSAENNIYLVPVDDEEEERLETQDLLFHHLFGEQLFFPRIQNPRKVLDCGYGRGQWAKRFAEEHENSSVVAVDLYPENLDDVPENLTLENINLNENLLEYEGWENERNSFDLIHSRCVGPGIDADRWPRYIRDLRRLLKKNGWVQLVEYYYIIQSDSGRIGDEHAIHQWGQAYRSVSQTMDRDPRIGRPGRLVQLLRDAGLSDVQERNFNIPIGSWPTDARTRWFGEQNLENVKGMIESLALLPFTAHLGWTKQQVDILIQRAQAELADATLKPYIPLTVAWGRKR